MDAVTSLVLTSLTSAYLSQHRARHCCSELPKLLDGFVTHFSKHLSRTVYKKLITLKVSTFTVHNFDAVSCLMFCCIRHSIHSCIPYRIPADTPC